jgi:hypothetical protein
MHVTVSYLLLVHSYLLNQVGAAAASLANVYNILISRATAFVTSACHICAIFKVQLRSSLTSVSV